MVRGSSFRLRRTYSRHTRDEDQPDKNNHFENFTNSPITPTASPTHCTVSGGLALSLRLSRVAGLAPLEMKQLDPKTWEIRVSKTAYFYSMLFIVVLNIISVVSVVLDLKVDRDHSIRMRTPTKSLIWLLDTGFVILTTNIHAYAAPVTMQAIIGFLSQIQKISLDINSSVIPSRTEKKLKVLAVSFVSLSTIIFLFDYVMVAGYSIYNNRNMTVLFMYTAYYILYYDLVFVNLLFSLIVLIMSSALKAVNDHLERICQIITNEGLQSIGDNAMIERHEIPLDATVPLKSINIVIDKMTTMTDILLPKKRSVPETIRALGLSYMEVCELIEGLNKCFGVIALMILLTTVIHLIITPYYLLTALFMRADTVRTVLTQSAWLIKHVITLLLLVEPCHWTFQELTRTRELIVQLSCRTATAMGPFVVELRKLYWCVSLNKTVYSPLGVCTLTRPILAVITGAVTTYLVVVMQFNTQADAYD